jgi:predicted NUDIX family NTP pyrophosphohydrolase
LEWPAKSGQIQQFPEVDRAEWFTVEEARKRIIGGQIGLLDQLTSALEPDKESTTEDAG